MAEFVNIKSRYKRNGQRGCCFIDCFNSLEINLSINKNVIPMNVIVNQYRNMLQKKRAQKLVVLLVSVTIVWQPQVYMRMCIAILCLEVE